MSYAVRVAASLPFVFALGCSVVDVGEPSGVFPCTVAEDCPDGQSCIVGKCFAGRAPTVEIVTPEDEQAFPYLMGGPDPGMLELNIKVSGSNLELVDAATDPDSEFGRGQIVVFVDGLEVAELTAGSLASGVDLMATVANTPGPHRVRAEARFSSGQSYDNPEAIGTRLFFIDDGNAWVGFKEPVPNQRFSFEEIDLDVTVAVINFDLIPAIGDDVPGAGHAHLLYNKEFPMCAMDDACRLDYIEVLAPPPGSEPTSSVTVRSSISSSAAGADTVLTALLSTVRHGEFLNNDGQPVFETIPIIRINAPAPDVDTGDEG
jgi:hypothetical protein